MGEGTCAFGTSCFYKHEDRYGVTQKELERVLVNADQEGLLIMQTNTLFDYLSL